MQETTKIYRIEVPGIEAAIGKMQQLNQEIALSKAIKQEAQKVLLANPSDTDAIEKQSRIIAENEVAIRKLNAEKQVAQKQTDLLIKASKEQAVADTNAAAAANLAAGSYNQLYATYKSLVDQYKATPPSNPLFDQIKTKAIEAKKQVDDFNRSLTPDGTLIGEYKSGILNAFKDLGLVNVIKDQKAQIEAQIQQLVNKNKDLAKEFENAGKAGKTSLAAVETQLKSNIETQQKLQANLNVINNTLNDGGGIGSKFTEALNDGFKEVIKSGLQVVGIGIGLHEAFDFIKDSIKEFTESDRIAAQLHNTLDNLGKSDAIPALTLEVQALRDKFRFLNESDLQQAQSKLIDFGKLTKNQITELLPIIVDFASKQRISIGEATDVITKSLEGSAKGLLSFGIRINNTATFTERLATIMTTLKEKVDGAADAFEKSAAGGMADTEQEIRKLKEDIGDTALPIWSGFLKWIDGAINGIKLLGQNVKDLYDEIFNPEQFDKSVEKQQQEIIDIAAGNLTKAFHDKSTQEISDQINSLNDALFQKNKLLSGYDRLRQAGVIIDDEDIERTTSGIKVIRAELDQLFKLQDSKGNDGILGVNAGDQKSAKQLAQEAAQARKERAAQIDEAAALEREKNLQEYELRKKDELKYQNDLYDIDKRAIDAKLIVFQGGLRDELRETSKLKGEMIKAELDHNDNLYRIYKDRYEAQKTLATQSAKELLDQTLNDPNASPKARIDAQLVYEQKLLEIQKNFNIQMDGIEKFLTKQSEKNAAERKAAIRKINDDIAKDLLESYRLFFENQLAAIQYQSEYKKNTIESIKQQQVLTVLKDTDSSEIKNQIDLIKILGQASLDTINVEIEATKKQIGAYQIRYGALAAILPQYQALLVLLNKLNTDAKQEQINSVNQIVSKIPTPSGQGTESFLTDQISKALGFDDKSDAGDQGNKKLIGQVIASSFSTATLAMNSYFDLEQHRIEQSKQLAYDRIDLETKIAKGRAQSQAELDAIDVQAAAKKKAANEKALEETKKLKKAEAKIALATELANIAVAASQNPLNGPTLGTAGVIEYGLLAGLAFARYFVNVGAINQATSFAKGGSLNEVLGNGGVFGGNSHAHGGNKFMYGNMPVETEAREAYVINKNATWDSGTYTVTGTPLQIASAINTIGGGRPFANNVQYRKMEFGGLLGENLQAPVNPGSFLGNLSGNNNLDDVKGMIVAQQGMIMSVMEQTNKRIDKIQVVQQTRTVRSAIAKEVRNESIATL